MIMHVKEYALPNGLKIVLVPKREMPTATMAVAVKVGSGHESRDENGLAHFIEHLLFSGTKKYTQNEIALQVFEMAADINARTYREFTKYYIKVTSKEILNAIDVLQDMIVNPSFEQDLLDKEKKVVLQEKAEHADDMSFIVFDLFVRLVCGENHAFSRPIIGLSDNISKFTRNDIVKYYNKTYNANNIVVVVAGNFPEIEVLEKLTAGFKSLKQGRELKFAPIKNQQKPNFLVKHLNIARTYIIVGVRVSNFYNDNFAVGFLTRLLNIILFSKIRQEKGLTYNIYTSNFSLDEEGILYTELSVEHSKIEEVVEIILQEMINFAKKSMLPSDFARRKRNYKNLIARGYETSDSIAKAYAMQKLNKGYLNTTEDELVEIDKLTASQIQNIAKQIFVDSNLNIAVISSRKDLEEKLEEILKF